MTTGKVFKYGDNVDTDVIIPARYLNAPDPAELAKHCMEDIDADYVDRVRPGDIIVGGANFGCGSSREHAPVALGAAGCKAVVAEYYARIFFRNSVATGEVYPFETAQPLVSEFRTGDEAELDTDAHTLTRLSDGKVFPLKDLGAVAPVVEAGGMFAYARQVGMIPSAK